ncbi:two pore domain potassium channel family protein [Pseudomonas sp. BN417]|uniref:potassium channel family protein n=1 Tax=Pseudomonas sp. BN417 TaxID=2567890 RepID=UPI00245814FA|nr:potassium channel family protein [Pseudomonas sp. BN417]MDH4558113.1 two pore domain potassium channel family protein [Pseudomonas sp. BN417]
MHSSIFFVWVLAAITVVVHAIGLAIMLRFLDHRGNVLMTRIEAISTRLVWVACYMVLLHLIAISVWGAFYVWQGCLPDLETAFYFSGVTYATIGYGDVVLAKPWRLFGLMEGLTGILMCGLSTGVFIAVVNQIYQSFQTKIVDQLP